jgi:toxin-antitoxin system PIN domain toxin
MTPDVNVLVAASRSDHPHHDPALAWLTGALTACQTGAAVEILPMIAAGFLRLVTNQKVFPEPAPPKDAVAFLRAILKVPGASMPQLGLEWSGVERLCLDLALTGNRVPDAWIAAAVSAGGYHLVTFDRGFRDLLRPSEYTLLRT